MLLDLNVCSPRVACAVLDHAFWPDDISLRDDERGDFSRVQGHHQITDLYLLVLAVGNGGRLATFDQAISLASMKGAAARHSHLL
ncbi:MAG: hypothetical protein IPG91_14930 [Ideonella sp.]|nr:hypothetical protein [Ideonella sp.]